MNTINNDDEPILSVVATPFTGEVIAKDYGIETESTTVSGENVPLVSKNETAINYVAQVVDALKNQYHANKHTLVVDIEETEQVDKGWFSHFDMGVSIGLDNGKLDIKVGEGSPKNIKKTKKTTIEFSLKDKEKT